MINNRYAKPTRLAVFPLSLALALGAAGAVRAEPTASPKPEIPVISDQAERKILGHMQEANLQRLQGWPGMIFYCPMEEAATPTLAEICAGTYKNLEALAQQNGVQFHKARNANDVALLPHLTGRLKLTIELVATPADSRPSAITARVVVLAHYTHAINRFSEVTSAYDEGQSKHPLNVPQHVDAVLWESTLIKAGNGGQEELARPVTDGLNDRLKAFFADYAKANPPSPAEAK